MNQEQLSHRESALNGIGWDYKLAGIFNIDNNLAAPRPADVANTAEGVTSFFKINLRADFNRAQFNIHGLLLSA
jgi:hypothetical protein